MFSNNLVAASKILGNNICMFVLDYHKSVQTERQRLKKIVRANGINIILFLNDFRFPNKEFFINREIAESADCRLWIWDSIYDVELVDDHIKLYSKIYSIEFNDIEYLQNRYSISATYLPLYAGPEFYANPRKLGEVQDIDLFFIGTIAGSKKRLETLEAVAKLAYEKNYKMLVLGRVWHNHHWWQEIIGKFKFARKYPYLSKVVENRVLSPDDVINYYKRTRINLNIHVEGHTGYNCRTFEVMGNNNFLLSDVQNKCGLVLKEETNFDIYKSPQELLEKIQYYLSHQEKRDQVASAGGKLVREKYNLVNALRIILS